MRRGVFGGLAAVCLLWAGSAAASEQCPFPADAAPSAPTLSRTRAALAAGGEFTVVAVGSSSTEGVGASSPSASYPAQLAAILTQRYPTVRVTVLNRGIGGETAGDNLIRFPRDVLAAKPDLVVWQVGTNDSFRRVPLPDFAAAIRRGAADVRATGADLILMNPQSYPDEAKAPSYRDYAASVIDLGRELGAPTLDRHRIMGWWLSSGRFPADSILSKDGLHLKDASYRCLAEFVSDMIGTPSQIQKSASAR